MISINWRILTKSFLFRIWRYVASVANFCCNSSLLSRWIDFNPEVRKKLFHVWSLITVCLFRTWNRADRPSFLASSYRSTFCRSPIWLGFKINIIGNEIKHLNYYWFQLRSLYTVSTITELKLKSSVSIWNLMGSLGLFAMNPWKFISCNVSHQLWFDK